MYMSRDPILLSQGEVGLFWGARGVHKVAKSYQCHNNSDIPSWDSYPHKNIWIFPQNLYSNAFAPRMSKYSLSLKAICTQADKIFAPRLTKYLHSG